jgi:hypothetical protein
MSGPLLISAGSRVRCIAEPGEDGPEVGWVGTVTNVDREEGLFLVTIAWDALRGNRAERRKHGIPLHCWGFQDAVLAAEYLEVVTVGDSGNA